MSVGVRCFLDGVWSDGKTIQTGLQFRFRVFVNLEELREAFRADWADVDCFIVPKIRGPVEIDRFFYRIHMLCTATTDHGAHLSIKFNLGGS